MMVSLRLMCVLVFTIRLTSGGRFGKWSNWSPCMKTCGTSIRIRSRFCEVKPCPPLPMREVEQCQERANCQGPWTTESYHSTEPEYTTVRTDPVHLTNGFPLVHTNNMPSKLTPEVDVAFLLDESISVSKHYVTLGKMFIARFLQQSLESFGSHIRYALCSFSSKFNIVFGYGDLDESGMMYTVDEIQFEGGSTNIERAMKQLTEGVLSRVRPEAQTILVLITDGFFETDPVVPPDVKTFAVAIGDNVNEPALSRFADGVVFSIQFDSDVQAAVAGLLATM